MRKEGRTVTRKPSHFEDWPASINPGFGPFRAVVQRVTDGDTLDVIVDTAFNSYRYLTIRVMGIDAPEMFGGSVEERERGRAAKAYLIGIAPVGARCLLRTDRDRQTFGRYVGSLLLADGKDVASEMVRAEHAVFSEW